VSYSLLGGMFPKRVNPLAAAVRIDDDGGHGDTPTSRHVHGAALGRAVDDAPSHAQVRGGAS